MTLPVFEEVGEMFKEVAECYKILIIGNAKKS